MTTYNTPGKLHYAQEKPSRFTAAYPGDCGRCWRDIEPGDEAGYIDNEVCCGDCCDERDD